jgi:hypothetical protein
VKHHEGSRSPGLLAALVLCCALGCAKGAASGAGAATTGSAGAGGPGGGAAAVAGAQAGAGGAGAPASVDAGLDRPGTADDARAPSDVAGASDAGAVGARDEAARDAAAAETPGVGGADGPRSAGCVGAAFALCEDFESGALDTKVWKLTQSKGTVTLDATRAASGKYSAHVHVEPGSDTTVGLVESKTFPTLETGLHARAFIYIPGAMTTSLFTGDRHSRLIYAQGATPYGEYALGIWNGGLIQNHYSKTDDSQDTKMLPPFDQWFCLEYELDAAAGNVRAYLNDVEITGLRHDGWPATNVDTLMFGVDRFGAFPVAEDIWFDDLVVDGAHIGCAR